MRIIKRKIFVNGEPYDIWLGLVNKSHRGVANIQLYYYAGDPAEQLQKPQLIKGGFKSEDEAIEYGKQFMKNLFKNALKRQSDQSKDTDKQE